MERERQSQTIFLAEEPGPHYPALSTASTEIYAQNGSGNAMKVIPHSVRKTQIGS
jgi:hypothetical protein